MGIIPGGRNGLAKRVVENMDMSAAKLAVVFTLACTIMGLYITYQDFRASYAGWGTYISGAIGDDNGMQQLAFVVSLAPQLLQTTLNVLFTADTGFVTWWTVVIYISSFTLDSALDYTYLTSRGGSPMMAAIIVFGVFFILSEVLLGVFGTLSLALAKEAWGKKKPAAGPHMSVLPGISPMAVHPVEKPTNHSNARAASHRPQRRVV